MNRTEPFHRFRKRPDPQAPFLRSRNGSWSYGDLHGWTRRLAGVIPDLDRVRRCGLTLRADPSDKSVFSIAACWLLRIPIFLPPPDLRPASAGSHRQPVPLPDLPLPDSQKKSVPRGETLSDGHPATDPESTDSDAADPSASGPDEFTPDVPDPTLNPDRPFGCLFTSGSTGRPKTVPLLRRQMLSAAAAADPRLQPDPDSHWLLCLPLHHTGGVAVVLRSLLYGRAIHLTAPSDSEEIARRLSGDPSVQVASLVSTQFKRLTEVAGFRPHNRLRALLIGGGPVSSTLLHRAGEQRIPFIVSYGMTETFGQIASGHAGSLSETSSHPKLKLFSPNEASVRNPTGEDLPPGEEGELWLRGPQVFKGYLNLADEPGAFDDSSNASPDRNSARTSQTPSAADEPRETGPESPAAATGNGPDLMEHPPDRSDFDPDGWFRTGDIARKCEAGSIRILARRTDLILSGGKNLRPAEIEQALEYLEEIREAAVTGLEDDEWGQIAVALVTLPPGTPFSELKLREKLREHLPSHKIPRRIISVPELPKTRSGKIDRRRLGELARRL